MKCGACGAETAKQDTRDVEYSFRGKLATLRAIRGQFCSTCGEITMTREEATRYGDQVAAFETQVNMDTGEPALIEEMLERLSLTREDAGQLLGVSARALFRYIHGAAAAPAPLIQLLSSLKQFPAFLDVFAEQYRQRHLVNNAVAHAIAAGDLDRMHLEGAEPSAFSRALASPMPPGPWGSVTASLEKKGLYPVDLDSLTREKTFRLVKFGGRFVDPSTTIHEQIGLMTIGGVVVKSSTS